MIKKSLKHSNLIERADIFFISYTMGSPDFKGLNAEFNEDDGFDSLLEEYKILRDENKHLKRLLEEKDEEIQRLRNQIQQPESILHSTLSSPINRLNIQSPNVISSASTPHQSQNNG